MVRSKKTLGVSEVVPERRILSSCSVLTEPSPVQVEEDPNGPTLVPEWYTGPRTGSDTQPQDTRTQVLTTVQDK